jgi:hypothetical protein
MGQSWIGVIENIEPKCNTHIWVLAYIFIKPLHKLIMKRAMQHRHLVICILFDDYWFQVENE